MANSGSAFERQIAKRLSYWWSDGKRDDIFWRTAGSGARATTRAKRGQTTEGQYGDIASSVDEGKALMELVTIELKCGYSKDAPGILLDKLPHHKLSKFEEWVWDIWCDAEMAESAGWWLIHHRHARASLLWQPTALLALFTDNGMFWGGLPCPNARLQFEIDDTSFDLTCMPWEAFLDNVDPDDIRGIINGRRSS